MQIIEIQVTSTGRIVPATTATPMIVDGWAEAFATAQSLSVRHANTVDGFGVYRDSADIYVDEPRYVAESGGKLYEV